MNISPQLTQAGWDLLTRAIGGDPITFTMMKVGDGNPPQTPSELTDLVSVVYSFGITGINTDTPKQVVVSGRFDSSQIPSDFWFREVGLFCAADQLDSFTGDGATTDFTLTALSGGGYPYAVKGITINGSAFTGSATYDAETGTVSFETAPANGAAIIVDALEENLLYAYLNAGDDAGKVAKVDALPRDFTINMAVVIGEAEHVTAILTADQAYAQQSDLDRLEEIVNAHVNRRDNPHLVTAAQLGLGNVAAPTYTATAGTQALVSGEALSNALAKLAGHVIDKNNPHEVKVADLTGTLPISKGGTGGTGTGGSMGDLWFSLLNNTGGSPNIRFGTYLGNGSAKRRLDLNMTGALFVLVVRQTGINNPINGMSEQGAIYTGGIATSEFQCHVNTFTPSTQKTWGNGTAILADGAAGCFYVGTNHAYGVHLNDSNARYFYIAIRSNTTNAFGNATIN